jgi:rubrerythrin
VQEGLIDSTLDVARCSNTGCGALLPISDRPERCPVCGRA